MAQKALLVKILSNIINSAGYDMSSAVDDVFPVNGKAIVLTDIAVAMPKGTCGRIAPRSGLAAIHNLAVGAGVIDADWEC